MRHCINEYKSAYYVLKCRSTIWNNQNEKGLNIRTKSALQILLIFAGDVELLPGPNQKCIACTKLLRKNQSIASCENCKVNIHMKCVIDRIEGQSEKLYCSLCVLNQVGNTNSNCVEDAVETCGYVDLNSLIKARGLDSISSKCEWFA